MRRVVHFHADALWQFVANREQTKDEPVVLHAQHLLHADPTLLDLVTMKPGEVAVRADPGRPWRILNFRRDEDFDEMLRRGDLS